jgi:hypothetical protein
LPCRTPGFCSGTAPRIPVWALGLWHVLSSTPLLAPAQSPPFRVAPVPRVPLITGDAPWECPVTGCMLRACIVHSCRRPCPSCAKLIGMLLSTPLWIATTDPCRLPLVCSLPSYRVQCSCCVHSLPQKISTLLLCYSSVLQMMQGHCGTASINLLVVVPPQHTDTLLRCSPSFSSASSRFPTPFSYHISHIDVSMGDARPRCSYVALHT